MRSVQQVGLAAAFVGLFTLFATQAGAEAEALTQRLEALDDEDRALLAPYLKRGPVALVELSHGDTLPSVLVAAQVEAPAELAAAVIASPQDYPKFMPTLDHVDVLSKTATQTAYKWTWQTGVLFLEGENRMTAFAPPKGKPELGHRISVKSERGQLGEGRLLWRILPLGKQRSLVMLSMRIDMRDANFVMRQLDAAARSVNRSVNIALCHVMVLGAKREAEQRAGKQPVLLEQIALEPPKVDLPKLSKLLGRADLLLMELTPSGLGKLSIVGRTDLPRDKLMPIISEPESFGKSLVPGSYTKVTKREAGQKTFQWGIGLPLIGTSGTMTMRDENGTLAIDAVEGAMKGGKWRFDTPTLPSGEAVVVGYSQFDISKSSWLIEKITSLDPVMGHGLAAATQVMLLRALRKRAHDELHAPAGPETPAPAPAGGSATAPAERAAVR
jgi:Polyketide cyclase / dehydrase and lipid transport